KPRRFRGQFFGWKIPTGSLTGAKLLQNSVLEGLGRAQTNNGLRLDLDGFAGLRIAAHARLAVRLHHASDSGTNELACGTLGFFHGELVQLFEEERRLLLWTAELLGEVCNDLGFAEWLSCHLVCLSSCKLLSVPLEAGRAAKFLRLPLGLGRKNSSRTDY